MANADRVYVLLAKKKSGEASTEELLELDRLLEQHGLLGHASEVIDKVWEAPLVANLELRPEAKVWDRLEKQIKQPAAHRIIQKPAIRWVAAACLLILAGSAILWFQKDKKPRAAEA